MAVFGEVKEITGESVFEWKLKDFFSLSANVDDCYCSPSFYFVGASWFLKIFPNGQTKATLDNLYLDDNIKTDGYIDLYLFHESPGFPINLEYSLGIKSMNKEIEEFADNGIFRSLAGHSYVKGHGCVSFIKRSKLLERKAELVPSDILSIVCKLKHPNTFTVGHLEGDCRSSSSNYTTSDDNLSSSCSSKYQDVCESISPQSQIAVAECLYCKKPFNMEDISLHQEKCRVKCPKCLDVVFYQNWHNHKCQISKKKDRFLTQCCES